MGALNPVSPMDLSLEPDSWLCGHPPGVKLGEFSPCGRARALSFAESFCLKKRFLINLMTSKKFSGFLISTIAIFLSFHVFALYSFLYWKLPLLDNMMHFAGGFLVALVMIWRMHFSGKNSLPALPFVFSLVIILGAVSLVGVLWEFYEFLSDKFITKNNYISLMQPGLVDTMKDLALDLSGGLLAGLLFLFIRNKRIKI